MWHVTPSEAYALKSVQPIGVHCVSNMLGGKTNVDSANLSHRWVGWRDKLQREPSFGPCLT